jgi:4-amino-4-deoxy-L-arabinose transferase-like glycosyltransferase
MTRSEPADTASGERRWLRGLAVILGGYYVLLGAAYLSKPSGVLGILGGLAVWAALYTSTRSQRLARALLVLAALPFAVLTWWSVVTPHRRSPAGDRNGSDSLNSPAPTRIGPGV